MSPVFGFNTDIRYGDTVYHVQTEAHEADRTFQTAVFVRGRCVDKQQTSYAQEASQPGFSEGSVHQLLTNQHKFVVNTIREGRFSSLMNMRTQVPAPAFPAAQAVPQRIEGPPLPVPIPRPVADPTWESVPTATFAEGSSEAPEAAAAGIEAVVPEASSPELKLEWLSSESVINAVSAKLRYRLTLGSRAIEGAKVVARLEVGRIPSAYARSVTDCEGEAELSFKLPGSAQTAESLSFTAQVTHSGRSVTRRFSLNRTA